MGKDEKIENYLFISRLLQMRTQAALSNEVIIQLLLILQQNF
jgi:hypothetical protein